MNRYRCIYPVEHTSLRAYATSIDEACIFLALHLQLPARDIVVEELSLNDEPTTLFEGRIAPGA